MPGYDSMERTPTHPGGGAALGNTVGPSESRPLAVALDRSDKNLAVLRDNLANLAQRLQPSLSHPLPSGPEVAAPGSNSPSIGSSAIVSHVMRQGDAVSEMIQIVKFLHGSLEV